MLNGKKEKKIEKAWLRKYLKTFLGVITCKFRNVYFQISIMIRILNLDNSKIF